MPPGCLLTRLFLFAAVSMCPVLLLGQESFPQSRASSVGVEPETSSSANIPVLPGDGPLDPMGSESSVSSIGPPPPEFDFPNEPGWTLPPPPAPPPPCPAATPPHAQVTASALADSGVAVAFIQPCIQINPYKRFLDATTPVPLSPSQKAYLAVHNFRDPGNLITIFGTAAFTIGTNSHTAYGPGWQGFLRNSAYSFSQDATGEFFGTFLIPSLTHEDPHYHRIPTASIPRRIFHAIARTAVAQHDDGSLMPNYAVLLTYPISAELSNLYVPGIHGNSPSTAERILTGLATDPVNNLITEFLPDVAKRVNIRVVFVQRVVNMITAGASTGALSQ